jgi:hypothetical protein
MNFAALFGFVVELMKSKHRQLYITVILIACLVNIGFFFGFTKNEVKANIEPISRQLDSVIQSRKQMDFEIQFYLKELDEIKSQLQRFDGKLDRMDNKLDRLRR